MTKNSWTAEFGRAFRNVSDLYRFLGWEMGPSLEEVARTYSIFVPERLAKKIREMGPQSALAREFLPHSSELHEDGREDPIGDRPNQKAPQLIHRYPSRALFTPTSICPVHCRYCFRKNELSPTDELFQADLEKSLQYLREHPEVTELIFTGGDPLTLSNQRLQKHLEAFSSVPTIKDVRFHTRWPVILPERVDDELLSVLGRATELFRTVSVAIHANHVDEFDDEVRRAITDLASLKLQLLSQSVLLKGVNDSTAELERLINLFVDLKVRPYYLHHPDQVKGGLHFYLSLEEGRELYASLRNRLPGWALPHYVLDVPGGHGKIPAFNPEKRQFSGSFLSREGGPVIFSEPSRLQ